MYQSILRNNRAFRFYLLSKSFTSLGNMMINMALLFFAFSLTGSSSYVTAMVAAQVLPYLLFGLIGGVLADWIPIKKWLIRMEIIKIPIIMIVVVLFYTQQLQYWQLIFLCLSIHTIGCLYDPASRALLMKVTVEEERTTANSLVDSITRGVVIVGPVGNLIILATIGKIHLFTVSIVSYLVSAIFLSFVKVYIHSDIKTNKLKIYRSLKEFFHWLIQHHILRNVIFITVVIVFFHTWVWQVGLFLLVEQMVTKGEEWYSILTSWYGLFVIVVNVIIPLFIKRFTMMQYVIGSFIWGAGISIVGLVNGLPFLFIGVSLAAIGLPISGLARVYLLQKHLPDEMLGRGFSFSAFTLYCANAFSLLLFGLFSHIVPVRFLFAICGLFICLFTFYYFVKLFRNVRGEMPYTLLKRRL